MKEENGMSATPVEPIVMRSSRVTVTLYCGDSLSLLPIEADAVVTDPPYGHGYKHSGSEVSGGGRNWHRRRGDAIMGFDVAFDPLPWIGYRRVVLWGANHYASKLPDSPAWFVWDKRDGTADNALSDCEMAWCNVGGSSRLKRHMWNGLCRDSEVG
jgi:site-specific DNA-methyltransferase (adenine-specific)/modification methylase